MLTEDKMKHDIKETFSPYWLGIKDDVKAGPL